MKRNLHQVNMRIFVLFLAFFLHYISASAQIINTIVGNSLPGAIGDGGSSLLAQLNHPKGVAKDLAGNIYIADAGNNKIRKINTAGIITTIAGTGAAGYTGDGMAATAAELNAPDGVALDSANNLYICDADNFVVRKINAAGIISTVVGTGISGYTGDGGPASAAQLNFPSAIAIDWFGNMFIADEYANVIRKVNTAGIISTYAGAGGGGYTGDGGPATAADIGFPFGVTTDGYGNVYVSLYYENRIVKINTAGIITVFAGIGTAGFSGDGGPATAAEMEGPWGIGADGAGNLLIADNVNGRIRKVNLAGNMSTIAGNGSSGFSGDGGPATAAQLRDPAGVLLSADGGVYIADYNNHAVRKITGTLTNAPSFTAGHTQTLTVCKNAAPAAINSQLAVADLDAGQFEMWKIVSAPSHGSLAAYYTAVSTGSAITPAGLTYTPTTGYSGTDIFKVKITDGTASDTTTINVTINDCSLGMSTVDDNNGLQVFPNPSGGRFTINLPGLISEDITITITDINGKKVKELHSITNVPSKIMLDGPAGVYLLRAKTQHGVCSKAILVTAEQ